jgi:hypothetical protein
MNFSAKRDLRSSLSSTARLDFSDVVQRPLVGPSYSDTDAIQTSGSRHCAISHAQRMLCSAIMNCNSD